MWWNGHSCLIPDFKRKAFNISPFCMIFAMIFSFVVFSYVEVYFVYLNWWVSMKLWWMKLYYIKNFIHSYQNDHMILSSLLLMWCIIFIALHILCQLYIPRVNPMWLWCILLCCWTGLLIFCENFCIYIYQGYWSMAFFSFSDLSGFAISVILASTN